MSTATLPPSGSERLASRLKTRLQSTRAERIVIEPDPARRFRPFPLADMQHAYWMGRQTAFSHSGAIQFYTQFRCRDLDVARLEAAWNRLIARHDMLRATVGADGMQVVAPEVPYQRIERRHLAGLDADRRQALLDATRRALQDECVPLEHWPQSRVLFDELDDGHGYLHIKLDLWNIDGRSLHILFDEWVRLYLDPQADLPALTMQFCDYIDALERQTAGPRYQRSLAWWQSRLATLPPAPELPRRPGGQDTDLRFVRWQGRLAEDRFAGLNDACRRRGLSLASVMLTVYARTLAKWSASRHFTLNVPRFNRPDWHPDIGNVIGEFASFSLLEVDLRKPASFAAQAARVQADLWEALDHQDVSGVRQLRELARLQGLAEVAAMPVVFTTTPPLRESAVLTTEEIASVFGETLHRVSRTPQVLIDCQYLVDARALQFNWDAMPGAFPDGLLDTLFDAFSGQLARLADDDSAWDGDLPVPLPAGQEAARRAAERSRNVREATPAQILLARARETPAAPALIGADGTRLDYAQLASLAGALAARLAADGVRPGDRITLLLARGWRQSVALLACQWLGAVAVPIDRHAPMARLGDLLRQVEPRRVLVDPGQDPAPLHPWAMLELDAQPLPENPPAMPPAPYRADAVSCVIFTSGTTGRPKGVEIRQDALANALQWSVDEFRLNAGDTTLAITALHHDMALFDHLATFCAGAALVVPEAGRDADPRHWLALMREHRVTVWNSVPRFMEMLVMAAEAPGLPIPDSLRLALLGGDWIAPALAAGLMEALPGLGLYSVGGPTETTLWNIAHRVTPEDTRQPSIPYGKPIANCRYYVLNEQAEECPDWVAGELYCGGISLARGYLGAPELTDERFITHPRSGERLYRTGDKGLRRGDGSLMILGRTDFQINAGGFRCDPLEIESAILAHPGVRRAIALEIQPGGGAAMLAVCYQPDKTSSCDEEALRRLAAERLPAAAVPRLFLAIDDVPLTANGKTDRRRLTQWAEQRWQGSGPGAVPGDGIERRLADIWSRLLGAPVNDANANFFALGGDSLIATRLLLQLEEAFGIRPPLSMVFTHASLRAMAKWLAEQATPTHADTALPLADLRHPPLSWAQERLWFMTQLAPDSPFFNLCYGLRLTGPLQVAALGRAFRRLAERHEPLRSRFPASAPAGTCVIGDAPDDLPGLTDLSALAHGAQQERLEAWAEREKRTGFDLENGPLWRASLFRLGKDNHTLFYTLHHLVFDGWSAELFTHELFALYREEADGTPALLPDIGHYAGFAQWQRDTPPTKLAATLDFWQRRLEGVPPLALPSDRPRPPVQRFRGALLHHRLDSALTRSLTDLSRRYDTTPFMILLCAMQIALGRLAGQERFVIGSVVSGRSHPATAAMIGLFIHAVSLRGDLAGSPSFAELLRRVRDEFLGAQAEQHYPLQALVQRLNAGADLSRNPLHQVSFTYQPAGLPEGTTGNLSLSSLPLAPDSTHMDLEILAMPHGEELLLTWIYATDLFDAESVERFHQAFECALRAALANPLAVIDDLPVASLEDTLRWACLDGGEALEGLDPWPRLARIAASRPDSTVLRHDDGRSWRWADLMTATERLAGWIDKHSGPDTPVAVRLHPGHDYTAAILAALRLGRAWMPLDPRRPERTVRDMLERAGAGCLVTEHALWETGIADMPPVHYADAPDTLMRETPPAYRPAPDTAPALIQHTSGSEGQPKAVEISYGNLRRRLAWGQTTAPLGETDVGCLKTSPAFVDAVGELLDSLLAGMTLIVPDPDQARSPLELAQLMRRHRLTRLVLTPSLADALLAVPDARPLPLRVLVLGGEKVGTELAQRCLDALPERALLLNYYGSTELTSDGAWHAITRDDLTRRGRQVPVGLPLPGSRIWLLDRQGRLAPPGMAGEIHVSGQNLASGYRGDSGSSATAFREWTPPDGPAVRLYATGDIATRDASGRLVCLGRRDHQLKLRGMRVEAGEIEHHLRSHPAVRDALIDVQGEGAAQRLVAHVLLRQDAAADCRQLREHLAHVLPASLLPGHWSLAHDWPHTATGKVDRRRLPRHGLFTAADRRHFLAASTPLQETIAGLWRGLLNEERIGIHDNFFEMGGNSLLLTQVQQKLAHALNTHVPLTLLFRYPTIHALAERLGTDQGADAPRQAVQQRAAARRAARGHTRS
ncbi:non-ribosomal peptide synthetase [Paludibacterium paludis]|uniref:Carrier domain-containing protein n=1 Tax=Paludibacterium paludis TaxID=1225769 RepID=A0A918P412_9NEIS|nr:non-ribosomal peptide synthetase [Paludibacterium paludis]GGY18429.1 hypothetical protein GCM10011289_22410 [Paludibacterium paludis]